MKIKKIFAGLFSLSLMLASAVQVPASASAASETYMAGDVNLDGSVNIKDAVLLHRSIAGGWGVEVNEKTADVNQDNKITIADVIILKRYLAGGWGIELKPVEISSGSEDTKPAGPEVGLPKDLKVKAGEEFTFKIPVTDNEGYTGLIAWLDVDDRYFDIVSAYGGDVDDPDWDFSKEYNNTTVNKYKKPDAVNETTLIFFYFDSECESLTGDRTLATVTLKAKEDTPAGTYNFGFVDSGDKSAKCNDVVINADGKKEIVVKEPTFGSGSVIVD